MRFAVLLAILFFAGPAFARAKVGSPAPPFSVVTFDGETISSKDLRGRVVILNFWATWCGPCQRELPQIDAYVRAHPGAALAIFAVDTEDSVPPSKLKPLDASLSFALAKRISGHNYGALDGVPTNYVIDRSGIVRWARAGAFDEQSLNAIVTPLLTEAMPAQTPARP